MHLRLYGCSHAFCCFDSITEGLYFLKRVHLEELRMVIYHIGIQLWLRRWSLPSKCSYSLILLLILPLNILIANFTRLLWALRRHLVKKVLFITNNTLLHVILNLISLTVLQIVTYPLKWILFSRILRHGRSKHNTPFSYLLINTVLPVIAHLLLVSFVARWHAPLILLNVARVSTHVALLICYLALSEILSEVLAKRERIISIIHRVLILLLIHHLSFFRNDLRLILLVAQLIQLV